jgi:hypothetical protein
MTLAGSSQTLFHLASDTTLRWIQVGMMVGIALALVATYLIARSNKRLDERIRRRREQRRAEADAAEANMDALAGRPDVPLNGGSQAKEDG